MHLPEGLPVIRRSLLLVALSCCAHAHAEDLLTIQGSYLCWEDDNGEEVCLAAKPTAPKRRKP